MGGQLSGAALRLPPADTEARAAARRQPLVEPIPAMGGRDPVGRDIADIPSVLQRIHDDWDEPSSSLNRLTAFTLQARLRKRLQAHAGDARRLGGPPHLGVRGLALAGRAIRLRPAPPLPRAQDRRALREQAPRPARPELPDAAGRLLIQEASHNFSDSCVLLISHSGGTFATLSISNLLKGFTHTSSW